MKRFLLILAIVGLALGYFLPPESKCRCCEPSNSSCCEENTANGCGCEIKPAPQRSEKIASPTTFQIPTLELLTLSQEQIWTWTDKIEQKHCSISDRSPPPHYLLLCNLRI